MSCRRGTVEGVEPIAGGFLSHKTYTEVFSCQGIEGFLVRQYWAYGLAIDIGTTTVVVYLVDLATGSTVDQRGGYNKQARYGDDVISRIIHATENDGLKELHLAVVATINELVDKLVQRHGIARTDICAAVVAANTTMAHLFLGLSPKYIRLDPYIPTASNFPLV